MTPRGGRTCRSIRTPSRSGSERRRARAWCSSGSQRPALARRVHPLRGRRQRVLHRPLLGRRPVRDARPGGARDRRGGTAPGRADAGRGCAGRSVRGSAGRPGQYGGAVCARAVCGCAAVLREPRALGPRRGRRPLRGRRRRVPARCGGPAGPHSPAGGVRKGAGAPGALHTPGERSGRAAGRGGGRVGGYGRGVRGGGVADRGVVAGVGGGSGSGGGGGGSAWAGGVEGHGFRAGWGGCGE
ncbi:hypothetical protein Saa2_06788 [Streptomyces acidiscabies]|nr:hypothetical protein Saa2_06788 [Streptomyces acidiscabies]